MSNDKGSTLINLPSFQKEITLDFRDLTYKSRYSNKTILKDVCGQFRPGRLSAIIGPSGAGKTSLVNILSGFKNCGVSGSILINGLQRKCSSFRQMSSYIPQEFAMLDKLTTNETLHVSADLKLGLFNANQKAKNTVIQNILKILNLEKCKNILVEQLSGGERKRLSIGIELITNPPLMFFDEPTSGLDSVSSLQIVTHLRSLAFDGRTIVCVIHQPSSRLLQLFDDVLVMSDGECIYNGPMNEMVNKFAEQNFICPQYYNPADFAIEIASKEHASDLGNLIKASKKNIISYNLPAELENSEDCSLLIDATSSFTNQEKNHNMTARSRKPMSADFLEQIIILVKRSFRTMSRDLLCIQIRVVAHILTAILIGTVYWDIGGDAGKIISNNSCIFFLLMFLFLANGMPTVLQVPLEISVFLREHLNNWYSLTAYYISKIIADLPIMLIPPSIFIAIAYHLTGQPNEFSRFVMCWGIALLLCILGHSFGSFAGALFGLHLAVFIVPATCIPMLIFSGYFIRYEELSVYLRPVTYISYFRYPFEGVIQSIYGFNRTDLKCKDIFCYYRTSEQFLRDMNMEGDRFGYDVLGSLVWICIFQISLFIGLIIRIKKSR